MVNVTTVKREDDVKPIKTEDRMGVKSENKTDSESDVPVEETTCNSKVRVPCDVCVTMEEFVNTNQN